MKIALLGDIGLLGGYTISQNKKLKEKLGKISRYLSQFDIVVGNLETPFSFRKKPHGAKSSYICADPSNCEVLKWLHIHAVTLANNHMFDFGKEGLDTTISSLEKAGIKWFGVNGKDYKVEVGGNRLAFTGVCCYSTNPLNLAKHLGKNGINPFNVSQISNVLKKNHEEGWLNIIAIHSGIEHVNRPSIDQIKISKHFAEIAPFIWYGHHPHVIQGIDLYKGSIIAHSLGNFCFAGNVSDKNRPIVKLNDNNKRGMILELEIESNKIIQSKATLIQINDDGGIDLFNGNQIVNEFSSYLLEAQNEPEKYLQERAKQRAEYLNHRKDMRNIKWILKRLRPRYARLFLSNIKNKKKYTKNVSRFLQE